MDDKENKYNYAHEPYPKKKRLFIGANDWLGINEYLSRDSERPVVS